MSEEKVTSKPKPVNDPFTGISGGDSITLTETELVQAVKSACKSNGGKAVSVKTVCELIGKDKGIENLVQLSKRVRHFERNLTGKKEVSKIGTTDFHRKKIGNKVYYFVA